MAKKKLLFRNRSMELGGVENVLLSVISALDKSKYEITLLLSFRQGEFLDRIPKEVRVVSIAGTSDNFSKFKPLRLIQRALRRLKIIKFQKFQSGFYKTHQLNDMDYEIAFSHNMFEDMLNSPNKKSKKISWFHGDLRNFWISEDRKLKLIEMMMKFDKRVFVSEFSKKGIEQKWNLSVEPSEIINNLLPLDEISRKSELPTEKDYGKINFLSIGRLQPSKGFMDLIEAHFKLIKEGYQIRTLILGEGYQHGELEQKINELGISDSFILGGYQSNPYPYYKTADYFVLSSHSEGYSLVTAEALFLGTPVIATKVGAVEEMVTDGKNGLLCEPGAGSLYAAMKKVLDSNFKADRVSADEFINRNQSVIKKIEELFN